MSQSFEEKFAEAQAAVSAISPSEANELHSNDTTTLFIDPRSADDISATTGIIPGALNVTLDDLNEKRSDELPQELSSSSRTIIAACQGGPMGAIAAHVLKKRGFSKVFYMDGGTQGWLDAGYATAR